MPIYDYKCPKCNTIEEKQVKINKVYTVPLCSKCDMSMIMQVSKPALHFRGSGFYATDYKDKK